MELITYYKCVLLHSKVHSSSQPHNNDGVGVFIVKVSLLLTHLSSSSILLLHHHHPPPSTSSTSLPQQQQQQQQQHPPLLLMHFPTSTQHRHWTTPSSPPPSYRIDPNKLARLIPLIISTTYSSKLIFTSLAYLRRYLAGLQEDKDCDGLLVVFSCIYLAGKVEELPPPLGWPGFFLLRGRK